MTALKLRRIVTKVMFDVIDASTLSINDNDLLYLNLPPNLFTSIDLEYCVKVFDMLVFKSFG